MPSDFGYINARVRGMHSRLLDPSVIEDLLATRDLDALIAALQNTPYGKELAEALTRRTGIAAVDEALSRNFHATTRKILGFAEGRPREAIELALRRYDLQNLLVVMRGIHTRRPPEEIAASLVPTGELGEVALRELAAQPTVLAVAATLATFGHAFAEPMRLAALAYGEARDLLTAELVLERAHAEQIRSGARGAGATDQVLRATLQRRLDVRNVLTAFKLHATDLRPAEKARFFLAGGSIPPELFNTLADPGTVERGLVTLHRLGFRHVTRPESVTDLERLLERELAAEEEARYRGDPLGLDVVLGYLAAKAHEVANLRLVARARLLGIPREMVRREMVRV